MLSAVALASAVLGLGYLLDVPAATATWPFPVTRITYVFLAAVSLAFAAPVAWVAWTLDLSALAGIGLTVATAYAIFAAVVATLFGSNSGLVVNLVLAVAVALVGLAGFLVGLRHEPIDRRLTPAHVRAAFVVLAVILVLAGGAMLLRVPEVLPWNVDLATQQLVGAIFVGDAAYFLYALARPAWPNAAGALLAFLAYDVVLAIPLLGHLGVVRPEHRLGLILYLIVVFATLVLAVYQLALDPRTRITGPAATGTSR